jgi:outer membrane protein OmpA-like peptidoglycan-associated protein
MAMSGSNPTTGDMSPIAVNDTNLAFAYQGIAGVAVALAENLVLDLSYRYHRTEDQNYAGTFVGGPASFDTNLASHNLFAGLRWNFGATAAPVQAVTEYKDCWDGSSVPVSASCPEQIMDTPDVDLDPVAFTVYFDYDKSNLTPEASNLVREAASRAMANDIDTVVVTGNTDTSGGAAYNERLSARRAAVVRDALIANGVSADRIRTEALGETNLAKPTPDGTREPLNRRTDVTISFE